MKPEMIGNVNATNLAKLWKGKTFLGTCADTPNACAYAMAKTGATKAVSKYVKYSRKQLADRVKYAGWLRDDNEAQLRRRGE